LAAVWETSAWKLHGFSEGTATVKVPVLALSDPTIVPCHQSLSVQVDVVPVGMTNVDWLAESVGWTGEAKAGAESATTTPVTPRKTARRRTMSPVL
jgi:hypothetical protein